jgi:hypothetical protein
MRCSADHLDEQCHMSIPITSVKFWLNAFIPKEIPGYTRPVPGNPGITMIPGPNAPLVGAVARLQVEGRGIRPGVMPLEITEYGYHTDQRTFSNDIHASSRMHSEARLDLRSRPPALTQWHHCDETLEYDAMSGNKVNRKVGSTTRMSFWMMPQIDPDSVMIEFKCAAHNPCAESSAILGDIDYAGTLRFYPRRRRLELDALIDDFPAFEAYATLNDGAGVTLFRQLPPSGNTVMNLPGPPRRPMRCAVEDRDGNAIFETLTSL